MKTSVTYNPASGQGSTTWGGYSFQAGKAVEVDDPRLVEKARNNPFFKVGGQKEAREVPNAQRAAEESRKFEEAMDDAVDSDIKRDHSAELASRANEQRKRGRPVVLKDRAYVRSRADGLA